MADFFEVVHAYLLSVLSGSNDGSIIHQAGKLGSCVGVGLKRQLCQINVLCMSTISQVDLKISLFNSKSSLETLFHVWKTDGTLSLANSS